MCLQEDRRVKVGGCLPKILEIFLENKKKMIQLLTVSMLLQFESKMTYFLKSCKNWILNLSSLHLDALG